MDIKSLFPTPLIRVDIDDGGGMAAELSRVILEHEAATPGTAHSNDGGWQSMDDFSEWSGPSGALLLSAVRETVNGLTGYFDGGTLNRGQFDWKVQAWANINRSGAGNLTHFHPGAFWSAVFYVDEGGS